MTLRKKATYQDICTQTQKTYQSKPKSPPPLKIARVCLRLDCQRNFIGIGPFQRLCELHREEN